MIVVYCQETKNIHNVKTYFLINGSMIFALKRHLPLPFGIIIKIKIKQVQSVIFCLIKYNISPLKRDRHYRSMI